MSVPWDKNLEKKLIEKEIKYQVVRQQFNIQYPKYKTKQSTILIGALGTITTLDKELKKIIKDKNQILKLI